MENSCCRHENQAMPHTDPLLELLEETCPVSFNLNFLPEKKKKKKKTQSTHGAVYFKGFFFPLCKFHFLKNRYSLQQIFLPIFYCPEYIQLASLHYITACLYKGFVFYFNLHHHLMMNINYISYREEGQRTAFLFNLQVYDILSYKRHNLFVNKVLISVPWNFSISTTLSFTQTYSVW